MHELLIAKYYPEAIDTSNIKVRCPQYYGTRYWRGGLSRQFNSFDNYLINEVKKLTGITTGYFTPDETDIDTYQVQVCFYRKNSILAPHVDANTEHSVLVQLRGTKKIGFYQLPYDPDNTFITFRDSKQLESITMSPGDVIDIDMVKSSKRKIGHGVPTCKGNSATAILRGWDLTKVLKSRQK